MNIFDEKNIELFSPEGVEFIYNILDSVGITDFKSLEAKNIGLTIIKKLFGLGLIEVYHWGTYHEDLNGQELSLKQIIALIEKVWFVGADYPDFFGMPMFKYKDWYLKALEKEGLTITTNWKTFVKEEIGDLEQWIEKNRPKK